MAIFRHFTKIALLIGVLNAFSSQSLAESSAELSSGQGPLSPVTEDDFNRIIEQFRIIFSPTVKQYGVDLVIESRWQEDLRHAGATKSGHEWIILVLGGIARNPTMTEDGFWMTLCHELGHLVGGYPMGSSQLAFEGQGDYFAAQACTRQIWRTQNDINSQFVSVVDPSARMQCDASWSDDRERSLCYRVLTAAKSFVDSLSAGPDQARFDGHDPLTVEQTYAEHPHSQCRLETFIAGALCIKAWDFSSIPGSLVIGDSAAMELDAKRTSCFSSEGNTIGARPRCWFKEVGPAP